MRWFIILVVLASSAHAQSTVYRHVDADGKVTYSDKPEKRDSAKVPNRLPPDPSSAAYDSAVIRSESERLQYERQRVENQTRPPVNIYDPRGTASGTPTAPGPSYPPRYRYDPNLPESPPPSSDRRYYCDGR